VTFYKELVPEVLNTRRIYADTFASFVCHHDNLSASQINTIIKPP